MKLLLDECVPRPLARKIVGHAVSTVVDEGWGGLSDRDLLSRAQERFDVFITTDRNLIHQQNVDALDLTVVVLVARSNRLGDLRALVPQVLAALEDEPDKRILIVGSR